jgi:hypothetical protein
MQPSNSTNGTSNRNSEKVMRRHCAELRASVKPNRNQRRRDFGSNRVDGPPGNCELAGA